MKELSAFEDNQERLKYKIESLLPDVQRIILKTYVPSQGLIGIHL
jgi:hypothetical protein